MIQFVVIVIGLYITTGIAIEYNIRNNYSSKTNSNIDWYFVFLWLPLFIYGLIQSDKFAKSFYSKRGD